MAGPVRLSLSTTHTHTRARAHAHAHTHAHARTRTQTYTHHAAARTRMQGGQDSSTRQRTLHMDLLSITYGTSQNWLVPHLPAIRRALQSRGACTRKWQHPTIGNPARPVASQNPLQRHHQASTYRPHRGGLHRKTKCMMVGGAYRLVRNTCPQAPQRIVWLAWWTPQLGL